MTNHFDQHTKTEASYPVTTVPLRARPHRSRRALLTAVVGMVGAVGLFGASLKAHADVLTKLPEKAADLDKKFAPVYDYDGDGCYATAAIGNDGKINPGLKLGGAMNGHCHDAAQLDNANTYSRGKCNHDWCGIMYASYFEKDQVMHIDNPRDLPGKNAGHKHDWEHVVIWVFKDKIEWVSWSEHAGWKKAKAADVRIDNNHAKIVYHKQGPSSHTFRLANADDDKIENATGRWFFPTLVDWGGFPNDFRDRLVKADFGDATIKISDEKFSGALKDAKPDEVKGFEP